MDHYNVHRAYVDGYLLINVDAGYRGTETVNPESEFEYERDLWRRRVQVSISPTGRSVRVFVDGREVK